jgi:hypothetical protein
MDQMRSGTKRKGGEACGDVLIGETFAANGRSADRSRVEGVEKEAELAALAETSEFERGTVETISEATQGSGGEVNLLPAGESGAAT